MAAIGLRANDTMVRAALKSSRRRAVCKITLFLSSVEKEELEIWYRILQRVLAARKPPIVKSTMYPRLQIPYMIVQGNMRGLGGPKSGKSRCRHTSGIPVAEGMLKRIVPSISFKKRSGVTGT